MLLTSAAEVPTRCHYTTALGRPGHNLTVRQRRADRALFCGTFAHDWGQLGARRPVLPGVTTAQICANGCTVSKQPRVIRDRASTLRNQPAVSPAQVDR